MTDDRPSHPSISDFPTLAAARSGTDSLEYGLKLIGEGLKAGSIANARYKDAYFVLTRVMEDAWRAAVMDRFPLYGKIPAADEAREKYPYAPTFLRMEKPRAAFVAMRDAEKDARVRAIHEAAVRFYDECMPLANVVLWARAHAVKRPPPAPAPAEETRPRATQEGRRVVREALAETLETVRAEYRADLLERCLDSVSFIERKLLGGEIKLAQASEYGFQGLFVTAFETFTDSSTGKPAARRRDDWNEAVERFVDRSVTGTFRQFTEKNVEKLGAIIELKGGRAPDRKLIDASVRGGVLETRIVFSFEDGSSFEVKNQIVEQYSALGRPYVRFPTTFHDVRLHDGSALTQPSESLMKTAFVGLEKQDEEPTAPSP